MWWAGPGFRLACLQGLGMLTVRVLAARMAARLACRSLGVRRG